MDSKISKKDIFDYLCEILSSEFDINNSIINENSNLFTDLELDSIDAVDIAVRLQKFTNKRISPEEFKQIKTINDVVEAVYKLIYG